MALAVRMFFSPIAILYPFPSHFPSHFFNKIRKELNKDLPTSKISLQLSAQGSSIIWILWNLLFMQNTVHDESSTV